MEDDLKFPLPPQEQAFLDAAISGNVVRLRLLLAEGVPVEVLDNRDMPWGQTGLMHAAQGGHLEAVHFLLEAGARVSTKDRGDHEVDRNRQPLHYAMLGKNVAVVEALLDAHANPNAESHFGVTPLNVAIEADNVEGVRLLLRRGAKVEHKPHSRHYIPSLSLAAMLARPALVRLLLEAGADPNATNARGQTPLMYANMASSLIAGHGDAANEFVVEIIEELLRAGAQVNHTGDGKTALSLAVIHGNCRAARALLTAGANANFIYEKFQGTLLDVVERKIAVCQKDPPTESGPPSVFILERLEVWQEMLMLLREFGAKQASE
jgi:ankyrin repeat protein